MKKFYILLLGILLGSASFAQISVELHNYTSMQATSDDPLNMDFDVINTGATIPTGDTIVVAFLLTDLSTFVSNYAVDGLTAGSVNLIVLTQDFNNGDTIPITNTTQMDMQWIYDQENELNLNVCATAAVGLASFQSGGGDQMCVDYTVTHVAGVEENNVSAINVYPNPVSNELNIDLGNNDVDQVQIIDLSGRIVESVQVNDNIEQVNVSDYENGVYFYQVINDEAVIKTDKFVVSK